MSNLKDKIWLTSKTRMFSEKRYRLYHLTSHLCLTYMSLLIIITSVFSGELALVVQYLDKIIITLALLLFTTSLIIYGFGFSEMANKHRDCYLKLQGLEQNFDEQSDPGAVYQEILSCYPNHAQRDYEDLVLDRTLFGTRRLQSGEENINWTVWMLLKKVIRVAAFGVVILVILALPFVLHFSFISLFLVVPAG